MDDHWDGVDLWSRTHLRRDVALPLVAAQLWMAVRKSRRREAGSRIAFRSAGLRFRALFRPSELRLCEFRFGLFQNRQDLLSRF